MRDSFWARHGGIILGGAVLAVVLMIVLPGSRLALDLMLTVNLFAAALVLLLVLSVRAPLELSSFPTLMLLGSLFRLALCIAAARLIVAGADPGTLVGLVGRLTAIGSAGSALIVALVLAIVDLVVVSAGAGRAAEVAARFSLDALPGKQLGVDSGVAAGALDDAEAQQRRQELQAEADFHAAMDGAARFARGEAIACVAILALCLVGGVVTGFTAGEANGLGQLWMHHVELCAGLAVLILVPGLLSCVSAALLVTRGGGQLAPAQDVLAHMRLRPAALWVAALLLVALAVAAPFLGAGIVGVVPPLLVAGGAVAWALWARKQSEQALALAPGASAGSTRDADHGAPPLTRGIEIRLGLGLIGMIPIQGPGQLLEQASSVRTQIADETCVPMPPIVVRDWDELRPSQYAFCLRGQEVARGRLMLSKMLAVGGERRGPHRAQRAPGRTALSPLWIDPGQSSQWRADGFSVLAPPDALLAHFEVTLRRHAAAFVDRQSAQVLIQQAQATRPAVAAELHGQGVSLGTVRAVLGALVDEGVPLSDPIGILEGILDVDEERASVGNGAGRRALCAEAARRRLAPTITASCRTPDGQIYALTLGPNAERFVADALAGAAPGQLAPLPPAESEALAQQIHRIGDHLSVPGAVPCLVCSPLARRSVSAALAEACPGVRVISWEELLPDAEIQHLGAVDIDRSAVSALGDGSTLSHEGPALPPPSSRPPAESR
ncbi:MAG: FHIPEP family type III secretion protein [Armatimonadota bacterium]|jgi:flagellar biosynthesis protein FlhA